MGAATYSYSQNNNSFFTTSAILHNLSKVNTNIVLRLDKNRTIHYILYIAVSIFSLSLFLNVINLENSRKEKVESAFIDCLSPLSSHIKKHDKAGLVFLSITTLLFKQNSAKLYKIYFRGGCFQFSTLLLDKGHFSVSKSTDALTSTPLGKLAGISLDFQTHRSIFQSSTIGHRTKVLFHSLLALFNSSSTLHP